MENKLGALSKKNLDEMLMDSSIDAIIAIDNNCIVTAWNQAAALMYNVPKMQAPGKSLFKLITGLKEDTETVTAINNALKGYKAFVPASKAYAHRKHSENHYIPLSDDDGTVHGVMNIVHDVAHRIKAERELQRLNEELKKQYRQLKATADELASFTFITSNKVKEPIRNIYTGIEHLIKVEAGRLTDSGKATFRRMQTSLNRMDLLLDDILSIAQISTLEKSHTPVDLTELVKEVSIEIKNKFDTDPVIEVGELCVINGHKNYLHMLFYNLLHNAVKFNETTRPIVQVSCKKTVLNKEALFAADKEYYQVTITDNGIGLEEEDKEKIFTMFEKLHAGKYKGSGIGLTVAGKIMDAHNGFITVESTPGMGSSFHCFFPVTE